jgi:hypothetical protein
MRDGRSTPPTDAEPPVGGFDDGDTIVRKNFAAASASFQVLIRLQYLRGQVSVWLNYLENETTSSGVQVEGLVWSLRGLATVALDGGWAAYAAMCSECSERLVRMRRAGFPSADSLRLLGAWLASSDCYLRQPCSAGAVADLVARFGALPWEDTYNLTLQSQMFRALLLPA